MDRLLPRSGLGAGEEPPLDDDFWGTVGAILYALMEDAVRTAARFADTCGRRTVTARDTLYALKYEAHEFFERDGLEERVAALRAEDDEASETDEDDEDGADAERDDASETDEDASGDEDGADAERDEAPEAYTTDFVRGDELFHRAVLRVDAEWSSWDPTDPVKAMMKRAIDNTIAECVDASEA